MTEQKTTGKIPVVIFGANGYSGLELAKIILNHPYTKLIGCYSRNPHWKLNHELLNTKAADIPTFDLADLKKQLHQFKTAFLATPPEVSMEIAPILFDAGIQIIDLSGAFRLDSANFEKAYQMTHQCENLLSQTKYGLVPWADPKSSKQLISNPGCFATSILMALLPLIKHKIIDPQNIVIDSKSGTTGAGLKPKENLIFSEVDQDCTPYRVGKHQHLPEIEKYIVDMTGIEINPHFSTSLLPVRRGIISAIYLKSENRLSGYSSEKTLELMDEAYMNSYSNYPFVKYGKLEKSAHQDKLLLSLRKVVGTCRAHISYTLVKDKIYVFSTLDNLLKGAASQAIENFNQSHQYSIESGLIQNEVLL